MNDQAIQGTTPNASPPSPAAQCSAAIVSREKVMAAETALMMAATEFGRDWGCDQTRHPKSYWLELHLGRWAELARCALAYAACFEKPPNDQAEAPEPR